MMHKMTIVQHMHIHVYLHVHLHLHLHVLKTNTPTITFNTIFGPTLYTLLPHNQHYSTTDPLYYTFCYHKHIKKCTARHLLTTPRHEQQVYPEDRMISACKVFSLVCFKLKLKQTPFDL